MSKRNIVIPTPIWRRRLLSSVSLISLAAVMLTAETQGLAIDFTDDTFYATTGHYGSVRVKDTTTPANEYDSHPYGLLTYSSPSLKLTRGPEGTLRYGAHNLINSNSEDFTNTEKYSTTVTGSNQINFQAVDTARIVLGIVSTTGTLELVVQFSPSDAGKIVRLAFWASGTDGSGAGNSGDLVIPADGLLTYTRTLTSATIVGVFNGTAAIAQTVTVEHIHARRTPSDDTYLKTTSAAVYELPYEWDVNGDPLGIRIEEQRTNLCLYSNDLTQLNWWAFRVTSAKTATGPDGVANSASTLTATEANGLIQQNITSASAARISSVYIKRRTGTGNVYLSQGGTTGSNFITNGGFDADTNWNKGGSATISGGVVNFNATSDYLTQQLTGLTIGKAYLVTFDHTSIPDNNSGGVVTFTAASSWNYNNSGSRFSGTGSAKCIIVATSTSPFLNFSLPNAGIFSGATIDNVTLTELVETQLTVTSEWTRVNTDAATITDPALVLRLATSGDEVDVALFQDEVGAFATSPIETAGSIVTRAADNISLATSKFPSMLTGTVFSEFSSWNTDSVSAKQLVRLSATGNEVTVDVSIVTPRSIIKSGGVTEGFLTVTPAFAANVTHRLALAYAENDIAMCSLGGAISTDTAAIMPVTLTNMRLGLALNGHLHKVLLAPRRMTNTELQTLTAA